MNEKRTPRIDWLDYLKAFALLGVIFNHLVEEIQPGSWFVRPSGIWAIFLERVPNFLIQDSFSVSVIKILAWIGDFSPGVFILASGFGLSWAALYHQDQDNIDWIKFLQRRLLRLFPLYIFLHLLFFAATLAKNGSTADYMSPNFLLSILGIRITDVLFFYINPSWWFVWLILQLYIVFPFLYILLARVGVGRFLFLACLLTFLSRLSGLVGLRYSESLYYWMLGIFFGTRLVEFCAGMAFAVLIKEGARNQFQHLWEPRQIFLYSVLFLFIGLVSFFVRYGDLVDYFFVTLGLSGLFYTVWKTVFERRNRSSHLITILGSESYGIYLVHGLILQRVGRFLNGEWRLIGVIALIVASLPIGIYLSRLMNFLVQKWVQGIRPPFPLGSWMRAQKTSKTPLLENDRIIINTDTIPINLYTLYSPPNHRDVVARHTLAQAEADNEHFDGKTTE